MQRLLIIPSIFAILGAGAALGLPEAWGQRETLGVCLGLIGFMVLLSDLIVMSIGKVLNPGSILWTLIIAPGTILHELGHYLMCKLVLVEVTEVKLFSRNPETGQLGSVKFRFPKGPGHLSVIQGLLVAGGPFVSGCAAIFGILYALDPGRAMPRFHFQSVAVLQADLESFAHYIYEVTAGRSDILPWNLLAIYGLIAVGSAAAPSTVDFMAPFKIGAKRWAALLPALVFLGGLAAAVLFLEPFATALVTVLAVSAACQLLSFAVVLLMRGTLGVVASQLSKSSPEMRR